MSGNHTPHTPPPVDEEQTVSSLTFTLSYDIHTEQFNKEWMPFLETYEPWIFQFFMESGLPQPTAEAATADVVTAIFQSRNKSDVHPVRFRTRLFAITRDALNKFWKSSAGSRLVDGTPLHQCVSPLALENRLFEAYDVEFKAVAQKHVQASETDRDWNIFVRLTATDSLAEIANDLSLQQETITQIKDRVLNKLKQTIRSLDEKGIVDDES